MKTLIIGIPNLKEIEKDQKFGTARMAEITNEMVSYIGQRNCEIGNLDLQITVTDVSLTQSDRLALQDMAGVFANLLFFEGDMKKYTIDESQSQYCLIQLN